MDIWRVSTIQQNDTNDLIILDTVHRAGELRVLQGGQLWVIDVRPFELIGRPSISERERQI